MTVGTLQRVLTGNQDNIKPRCILSVGKKKKKSFIYSFKRQLVEHLVCAGHQEYNNEETESPSMGYKYCLAGCIKGAIHDSERA